MNVAMKTITQTADMTPLREIFPLADDVAECDDAYALSDLAELTRRALRPLVEAAWARRGYTVRWSHDQTAYRSLDDGEREAEVAVWGEAYDALDEEAILTVWRTGTR